VLIFNFIVASDEELLTELKLYSEKAQSKMKTHRYGLNF